eukprot:m.910368 g.910368  ORF g.910368 m.910368 type:complete len:100 (-) comp60109_c0_seq28:310-609(-)
MRATTSPICFIGCLRLPMHSCSSRPPNPPTKLSLLTLWSCSWKYLPPSFAIALATSRDFFNLSSILSQSDNFALLRCIFEKLSADNSPLSAFAGQDSSV